MTKTFLHRHPAFFDLLNIVGNDLRIQPALIEKDYWIMHVLFGLTGQGFLFELKGGTSLSKGFKIIERFSEDIDIHIHPPSEMNVVEDPRKEKDHHISSRRRYFDWLAANIEIDGIIEVTRDTHFDNSKYTSGGIRLNYTSVTEPVEGVKSGILLEVGFDTVTPNQRLSIGSWAIERAMEVIKDGVIDNMAVEVPCYEPGYSLIEKLQTIVRKYRIEKDTGIENPNYMRQYYDVSRLLLREDVQLFIGTEEYLRHKMARIKGKDAEIPLAENEAFLLSNPAIRASFAGRYAKTASLYYKGQPPFEELLTVIQRNLYRL